MESIPIQNTIKVIDKGRWQWQSNLDPFSKTEEPKWESYSLDDNYLLEKAYYDGKEKAELKDYIVFIKHMRQMKKGDVIRQRPVRRIDWNDCIEEMDRTERYLETEKPRTINKIFGSLKDFLSFFSKRNYEIFRFADLVEKIEKENDVESLNQDLIPILVGCLEELVKPVLEQPEDPLMSAIQKKLLVKEKKCHEELISLFKERSSSFEEFYGKVFRAYTMNTCLYECLNRHLRNEDWIEVDSLLPYALCLCKAFFNLKIQRDLTQDKVESKSNLLYRGTALDEIALSCYHKDKNEEKQFSWNSVTSTTTSRTVAEDFMYKSVDLKTKKYPVLFVIEVPVINNKMNSRYSEWVDVCQYSAKTDEKEVILPPGSVFEVVKVDIDSDKRAIIKLKLKNEIKSLAHRGLIMQGALQSKMMKDNKVKVVCLEGEELVDTLKGLTGNKLIEHVEFCLCTFDKGSFEAMVQTISTMITARSLKFTSCTYQDKEKILSGMWEKFKAWNVSKIEIWEMNTFYKVFGAESDDDRYWRSVSSKEFHIHFINRGTAKDSKVVSQLLQGLKDFKLLSLTILYSRDGKIENQRIINLVSQGLQYLTQLVSLTLDCSSCENITDKGIHFLASNGLRRLTQLVSLTLKFCSREKITNKGINSLASNGLQHLIQLKSLDLDLSFCECITDKGIHFLASNGLRRLTQLVSLTLKFCSREKITNKGINSLASNGLQHLIQLKSLDLDLFYCECITDEGINSLASNGLKFLAKLTFLALNLSWCDDITDKGIEIFAFEGLKHLTQLVSLTLDFSFCKKITKKGISSLASNELQLLTKLTSLTLNFKSCNQITDGDIESFKLQVPMHLRQIGVKYGPEGELIFKSDHSVENPRNHPRVVHFGFEEFYIVFQRVLKKQRSSISDKLSSFCKEHRTKIQESPSLVEHWTQSQSFFESHLFQIATSFSSGFDLSSRMDRSIVSDIYSQLTSLTLDFSKSKNITNDGIYCLASQGLKFLAQLTYLNLNFRQCEKITNDGIKSLSSKGLRHVTQLVSLALNFSCLEKITYRGVQSLACQGLQYLSQLTFLILDFQCCKQITDKGIHTLAFEGLRYLVQLTDLTLNFFNCPKITDKGVSNLVCHGIQHLIQFTSLTLNFASCDKITDEGVHILASQGLRHLSQLKSLNLDISFCAEIKDEGVNYLISHGIKPLTELRSFMLNVAYCGQITIFTILNIIKVMSYLGFVHSIDSENDDYWKEEDNYWKEEDNYWEEDYLEENNSEEDYSEDIHSEKMIYNKLINEDPLASSISINHSITGIE